MRLATALVGVVVFGAIAIAATAAREPAAEPAAAVAARFTAAPRAIESVPRDPAAAAPGVDPERYAPAVALRHLVVRGLSLPIADAAIPTDPDLLPGAPRDYRAGVHEGIDFPAPSGAPVLAVADGTIVRIDRDFLDWTREVREMALFESVTLGYTPTATLDRIRGRQVWIDHGRGVVTRYAHLSEVAAFAVGARVERGAIVGAVGSSGYPEGGPHLHLEVRIDDDYLGDGLAGDALIAAIARAFG